MRRGTGTIARTALTSVGPNRELARLRVLLSERRLVTITGPGGAGKTRLAEELVAALSSRSRVASRSPIWLRRRRRSRSARWWRRRSGCGTEARGPSGPSSIQYLGDQRLLLVLDNCEHLAATSAGSRLRAAARVPRHHDRGHRPPAPACARRAALPDRRAPARRRQPTLRRPGPAGSTRLRVFYAASGQPVKEVAHGSRGCPLRSNSRQLRCGAWASRTFPAGSRGTCPTSPRAARWVPNASEPSGRPSPGATTC